MRFTIEIKPTIIRGSGTLRQAKDRVSGSVNQCFCYSSFGDGWMNSKYVYGYNIEVFKRGKYRKDKHYVIYRYTFPKEIFQMLNVRIKQGSRTFKILKQ